MTKKIDAVRQVQIAPFLGSDVWDECWLVSKMKLSVDNVQEFFKKQLHRDGVVSEIQAKDTPFWIYRLDMVPSQKDVDKAIEEMRNNA